MIERREPLKRGKPPTRSRLKRPTIEQVRAWQAKPRKAIAKIGAKAKREAVALNAFRGALVDRSHGFCEGPRAVFLDDGEVIIVPHAARGRHHGCDPHHLWPEDRDRGVHDPARGMWLCRPAHNFTDDEPALAHRAGMLRPEATIEP